MTATITHEVYTVHTRVPFVIARGSTSEFRVVKVIVRGADGAEGWGEAAPNKFYGESCESVVSAVDRFRPILAEIDDWSLEEIEGAMNRELRLNGAAKSAISAAYHDLAAKRLGIPLYRLWGLDPARAPLSSYTIPIAADAGQLRERVAQAASYPVLKVKLGTSRDGEIVRVVRESAPEKTLRVDANAAWTAKEAVAMLGVLAEHGVELLEQPVAADDHEGLALVRRRSTIPVIADESCVTAADVPRLAGRVDGVNLKLSKCGGLREALRIIATARAHRMLVMAGCMIETSLGISAAAHLSPLLDYADLDGAALLADDPHVGASIDGGVIRIPRGPGLGVSLRAG
jgi:L-Ala-D/L-Glu epimerase